MNKLSHDDDAHSLFRRVYTEDVVGSGFDVEAGLRDVLGRVGVADREADAAGDQESFNALIARFTPLVWHVARANGLGSRQAEDVVQTVWLVLLRNLHRLADSRALAGWLIAATRREANRVAHRHGAAQAPRQDTARPVGDDQRLWHAFQQLPPRCQDLLRLTALAGRPDYRAVAEALHMPRGVVGPARRRCLTTLRALYEREAE